MPPMKAAENEGAELFDSRKGDWLDLARVIDGKRVYMSWGPSPLNGEEKIIEVDPIEVYKALHEGNTKFKVTQGELTRDVVIST